MMEIVFFAVFVLALLFMVGIGLRDWHLREVCHARLQGFAEGKRCADTALAEEMAGNVLRYYELRERFRKALEDAQ